MTRYLWILVFTICLLQCRKLGLIKDDDFEFSRMSHVGNELKLDGFYYLESPNNSVSKTYFFFRDGVSIKGPGTSAGEGLSVIEDYFSSPSWLQDRDHKYGWGIFLINNENITLETWEPSSGGGLPAYVSKGTILNDSTFVIKESRRSHESEITCRNDLYMFRHFSPKPDSTQTYID